MVVGEANTDKINEKIAAECDKLVAQLPDYSDLSGDDLSKLASMQDFFEKIASLLESDCTHAAVIAEQYKIMVESVMLGECIDETTIPSIISAAEKFSRLTSSNNPNELLNEIAENADSEISKDDSSDILDSSPPMGVLILNSQEDVLIYNEFTSESYDHLDNIEKDILSLEDGGDSKGIIDNVFRAFHSIKGAAGFLGLTAVSKLCHEGETMLDKARKGAISINAEINEVLLSTKDALCVMLDIIKTQVSENNNGEPLPNYDILPLLLEIKAVTSDALNEYQDNFTRNNEVIHGKLGGILLDEGVLTEPDLQRALTQQNRPLGDIVVEMGAASHDQIEQAIEHSGVSHVKQSSSIKVDASKLETLLEMAGELIVSHSQVTNYEELCNEEHIDFARNITNLGKIASVLQEAIMSLRLVPVKGLFNKMNRLVRDTAKKTNKLAVLKLFGEDTEIDKTVIDQVADPLVHLLRNAVDHGIESAEDRSAAGKDTHGIIKLKAYHSGGSVVIEISDDGKGINPDKVRNKAIQKNFIDEDSALSNKEIFNLIFLPGFSTHDVATDISGRGVGMDVVKRNINSLGGNVEVESVMGQGTSFVIRLPLTMAIVDGMVIKLGEQRYVLPTLNIDESIKPARENITGITGKKALALQVRGELVPLIELGAVFDMSVTKNIEDKIVVIVRNDRQRCGLIIDDVLEQQQVVIKNLGKQLQGLVGVSGGCILGDGRVGLILDIPSLIKLANSL